MIKVFLVEDEKIIRKSIKNNVKWEENGFEFAGEAPDGEMALPMIEKLHPDIVITDIKMPFMDGLELSDILKKKMPKIQIIILSGYGEFDYAKEAIKIGVTDYLTKPVTGEQLLEALNKVKQKLDKKKRQEGRHLLQNIFLRHLNYQSDYLKNHTYLTKSVILIVHSLFVPSAAVTRYLNSLAEKSPGVPSLGAPFKGVTLAAVETSI